MSTMLADICEHVHLSLPTPYIWSPNWAVCDIKYGAHSQKLDDPSIMWFCEVK